MAYKVNAYKATWFFIKKFNLKYRENEHYKCLSFLCQNDNNFKHLAWHWFCRSLLILLLKIKIVLFTLGTTTFSEALWSVSIAMIISNKLLNDWKYVEL